MPEPSSLNRFVAEGLVIVISILVAFWIDAWWDGRQEAEEESGVLEALLEEAERNRRQLDLFFQEPTWIWIGSTAFFAPMPGLSLGYQKPVRMSG